MNRSFAATPIVFSLLFTFSSYSSSGQYPQDGYSTLEQTPIQTISVTSNGTMYAGTFGGGVFMSNDHGETWRDRNAGLTDMDVFSLVANSDGTIFAGTFGGGVYRYNGSSVGWVQSNNGLDCTEIVSLEIAPDGFLYAGTSDHGLYRSRDNGESWSHIGLNGSYITTIMVNANDIVVGTNEGIQLSTNHGKSWRTVNYGLTCLDVRAITEYPDGNFLAATNGGGVFQSQNKGVTWSPTNNGLKNKCVGSITICRNDQLYVGTSSGVFRSSNYGASWAKVRDNLPNDAIACLRMGGNGNVIAGTIRGSIYQSIPVVPLPEDLRASFAPVAFSDER